MNETRGRAILAGILPAATLSLLLVPYLLLRSELPDRIATHFDGSGTPDGSMTPAGLLMVSLVMVGVGLVGLVGLGWNSGRVPASMLPILGFLGGFVAGLSSGIAAMTFITQRDIADWTEADSVWLVLAGAIMMSIVSGSAAAYASSLLPAATPAEATPHRPVMELAAEEQAVFVERVSSAWLLRFGAGAIVIGVIVALGTFWWLMLPALVTGAVTISLAVLVVRADHSGLHVRYGWLPWPRTSIPIERVAAASVIDVRPMEWGGWGYRGSLKLMNQAAVVHRGGPGLRLDLTDGKVFVVTIDDPETPAGLLNAEIERSSEVGAPG